MVFTFMNNAVLKLKLGRIFSHLDQGLHWGNITMPVRAAIIYRSIDQIYGLVEYNTQEEVDAIIAAIDRVNQEWPGMFAPESPPKPMPVDADGKLDAKRVLWTFDSTITGAETETIMDVALGRGRHNDKMQ